jgi:hypothetical protein
MEEVDETDWKMESQIEGIHCFHKNGNIENFYEEGLEE